MAHLYNIAINFLMVFNKYHCILLNYASTISFAISIWVLFILLKHSVIGAQFLSIILLFLWPVRFAASLSLGPSIFIVPLTSIHASL